MASIWSISPRPEQWGNVPCIELHIDNITFSLGNLSYLGEISDVSQTIPHRGKYSSRYFELFNNCFSRRVFVKINNQDFISTVRSVSFRFLQAPGSLRIVRNGVVSPYPSPSVVYNTVVSGNGSSLHLLKVGMAGEKLWTSKM